MTPHACNIPHVAVTVCFVRALRDLAQQRAILRSRDGIVRRRAVARTEADLIELVEIAA